MYAMPMYVGYRYVYKKMPHWKTLQNFGSRIH